jgi:hypothetical protein
MAEWRDDLMTQELSRGTMRAPQKDEVGTHIALAPSRCHVIA